MPRLEDSGMDSRVAIRRNAMGCQQPMARDAIAKASTATEEAWAPFARATGNQYANPNSLSCGPAN
jgi:hypothetical protein